MSIKLFSASAGSGKTFTLTLEYIKLALREEDKRGYFRKILAVTFTIKAADEMRSRIIEFLQGISDPKSHHDAMLLNLIFDDFNLQGLNLTKSEISKRASNALQQILQDYGLFSVMTIDSFVQRLSATFIEELNLPSQFEVILDSNALMDQLIDQLLEKVNRFGDPVLTDLLIDFAKTEVSEGRSWNLLRANLHQFLRICLDESYFQIKPHMDVFSMTDFRRIEDQIKTQLGIVDSHLLELAAEFISYVDPLQYPDDYFSGGRYSAIHYFRRFLSTKISSDFVFTQLNKSIESNNWAASKIDKKAANEINDLADSLQSIGQSFVEYHQANKARNQILLWIARDVKKIALLASISEELFDYQNEHAAVSISEFSKRLYQVIANDPVPFIYEKLGDRYTHILIDEFQDTSMLQWQNFMPLLENAVSLGHQNLLVGDAKQSIYKFRGGEVGLIASLTNQDKQIIQAKLNEGSFDEERYDYLLESIINDNLAYNYRSAAEIVSFNNSFFTWIAEQEIYTSLSNLIKPIYGRLLAQIPNVKADKFTGHVDLSIFKKPKVDSETQDLEQTWMLANVIGLIEDNLRLGFNYADMAILTRKNKHARLLAIQLKEKGIPIISSDSLLIHYSNLVGVIVSFLKLKANPENEFLAYELIFQIQEISHNSKELDLVKDFKAQAKSSTTLLGNLLAYVTWPTDLKSFQELSLIQTIYAIIERFDLLNQREGTEYLFKFLDVVQDFSVTKSDDITDFLAYYELNKHSITIASPEGVNAVTITSIHKSKGLEYGVVIVPFANWTHQASLERIWYDLPVNSYPELALENHALRYTFGRVNAKEISGEPSLQEQSTDEKHSIFLDALNMMYVAFTRAKQRLHILTTVPSEDSSDPTKRVHRTSLAEILINYAENLSQPEIDLPDYTQEEFQLLTDYYILSTNLDVKYVAKKASTHADRLISIQSQIVPSPAFRIISQSADIYTQSKAKRTQGEYLHDVLAQIEGNRFWFANRNTRFIHLEKHIRQLVDQIMHDIELSQWFVDDELIFVERDILTPAGDIYRPDRVISKAGKCVIIDFKTGKRNDKHLDQIKLYKQLLGQLGQEVGSGVLLYLDDLSTIYV
jgi:ATP-dependent exoDNAse (exonuclease V) beta subunit